MNASPARARPRAARLSPEARRDQLLDAAAACVRRDGAAELTMEGLAAEAGVSKGLGYAYFDDAEDVAVQLWDREVGQVYQQVEAATGAVGAWRARWRAALRAYFDVIADRGVVLGALREHFGAARISRRSRRRVDAFVGFWAEQIRADFSLPRRDAIALAALMLGSAETAGRLWQGGLLTRDEAEALGAAYLTGGAAPFAKAARGLHDG